MKYKAVTKILQNKWDENADEMEFLVLGSSKLIRLSKENDEITDVISILNGEIRESCKKLCPDCNAPYITYTGDEYYECNSCGHTWI